MLKEKIKFIIKKLKFRDFDTFYPNTNAFYQVIPFRSFHHWLNPSIANMKKKEENGSLCFNPLGSSKSSLGIPLIITKIHGAQVLLDPHFSSFPKTLFLNT